MTSKSERCPLLNIGQPAHKIPTTCHSYCGQLWDRAVKNDHRSGDYDSYQPHTSEDDACLHEGCDVEFSHTTVKSLGKFTREYTIVDEYSCGEELGEQGFKFTCPLPIEE